MSLALSETPAPLSPQDTPNHRRTPRKLLVADLFCGGGGFSTGAARAIAARGETMQLVAVNHWTIAIETHAANHPNHRHICQDLGTVRPIAAVPEGRLDLLLASPSCTQHSRARAGRPIEDQKRTDPWNIITWLTELRVKRLLVENVPEFINFGPVNAVTGQPLKSRRGEYFQAWLRAIENLGFRCDWKILTCADYGDPTTRQRFFLKARSDGTRLRRPAPTHSPDGGTNLFGTTQRWRAAAEIIDWTTPGRSIYQRAKPLSEKTLLRILSGLVRFDWDPGYVERLSAYLLDHGTPASTIANTITRSRAATLREPHRARQRHAATPTLPLGFIANVAHGETSSSSGHHRIKPLDTPIGTIHAGGGAFSLVTPGPLTKQAYGGTPPNLATPAPTVANAVALLAPYYGAGSGQTCQSADSPLPTITTRDRFALVTPLSAKSDDTARLRSTATPASQARRTKPAAPTSRRALPSATPAFGEALEPCAQTPPTKARVPALSSAGTDDQVATAPALPRTTRSEEYDLLFRMLTVDELASATSLHTANTRYTLRGTQAERVKLVGNAVPSATAEALIRSILT